MANLIVVEDDRTLLSGLTTLLSLAGHHVRPQLSGQAALEAIQDDVPDVLITDVLMPGMNGVALMHAVYARPEWRDIPIIFISAGTTGELEKQLSHLEGVTFLRKPFEPEKLQEAITAALDARVKRVA